MGRGYAPRRACSCAGSNLTLIALILALAGLGIGITVLVVVWVVVHKGLPPGRHGLLSSPERIREYLKELARRRDTITYRDLAKVLEVQPPNTIHQVADALEVLMQEDHGNGAPFLAAIVVSKVRNGLPAPAFFSFARSLGRFKGLDTGPETQTYHSRELHSALDYWGSPP